MYFTFVTFEAEHRRATMLADAENHRLAKRAGAVRRRRAAAPATPVRRPATGRNLNADGRCPVSP